MRDLRYGIEIEMTGLSRGKAAESLAAPYPICRTEKQSV